MKKFIVKDEYVEDTLDILSNKVGGCPGLGLSDFCDDTKCECFDIMKNILEIVTPKIIESNYYIKFSE